MMTLFLEKEHNYFNKIIKKHCAHLKEILDK